MKKFFVLLFAIGSAVAVFAQDGYGRDEARNEVFGRNVYGGVYADHDRGFGVRERQREINRINRQFDWKIEAVEHNPYLRRGEKRRRIRELERERNIAIREMRYHEHY